MLDTGSAAFLAEQARWRGVRLLRIGRSGVLTAREREIANLASLGYSSKAIADRLVLSPRTVETHLRRVFNKLDISSREQLAPAFGLLER